MNYSDILPLLISFLGFQALTTGSVRSKNVLTIITTYLIIASLNLLPVLLLGCFNIKPNLTYLMLSLLSTSISLTQFFEKTPLKVCLTYAIIQIFILVPIFYVAVESSLNYLRCNSITLMFLFMAALYPVTSCLAAGKVIGPRLGRFTKDGRPMAIPGNNLVSIYFGSFIFSLSVVYFFESGSLEGADVLFANLSIAILASSFSSILVANKIDPLIIISSLFVFMTLTISNNLLPNKFLIYALTACMSFINIFSQNKLEQILLFDDPLFILVPLMLSSTAIILILSLVNPMLFLFYISIVICMWAVNRALLRVIGNFTVLRYTASQEEIGSDIKEIGFEAYPKIFKDF